MTIDEIARLAHEVNRVYCRSIGDDSQVPWDEAPLWQQQSVRRGVVYALTNPKASPAELHIREHMIADGGDPDKVQFVALPFPQLPAALEVGNVDAIGIAPPFLGQILGSQKITPVVVGEGMVATLETGGPTALGSWFAMQPWIEAGDNKDVAARFLKSVQESNEALMADRSLVDAILVRDFGMPAEVASHIPMNLLTTSLTAYPENYFEVIEAYKRTGMAEPNFTAEEFVTTLEYE